MAGIVSYGSYIAYRRLKRAAIAEVLGGVPGKGEKAVASFDEDSVSMAVEALRDALKGAPNATINSLFFATSTPPYAEKLNAAIVGAAALLPAEIRASDMTGSIRAGLSALLQATDAAKATGGYPAGSIRHPRPRPPEGPIAPPRRHGAGPFPLRGAKILPDDAHRPPTPRACCGDRAWWPLCARSVRWAEWSNRRAPFPPAALSSGAKFSGPSRRAAPTRSVPRGRRCCARRNGSSGSSVRDAPHVGRRNCPRSGHASNAASARRWSRTRSRTAPAESPPLRSPGWTHHRTRPRF